MNHGGRRAHYIRPNETTRIPRRHIVLDTEARRQVVDGVEVQTWRCAAATFLAAERRREPESRSGRYIDPAELWQAVSDHARPRKRTVLWAHNLAYDLRIGAVFDHLPALGWELTDLNLATHGAWVRWRRDGATLVMVDSTAVWPCSLATLAADLGMTKPELPADDDSDEAWWVRCEADVAILTAAVTDYLAWIEADDLGNWQITGAGQSWATWRHRFYTDRVLVHDDVEALAAERRAMWTGRCEVWRWGRAGAGGVYEYDLSAAYCRIARDVDVPVRLVACLGPVALERLDRLTGRYAVLADVEVTTSVPVVPTQVDGRICWPVGTFTTTLWDCEVYAAIDAGATVTVTRAWTYLAAPALAEWARWVLSELDDETATLSPIRRRVVKHWSRALIGRFAMRYRRWEHYATAPDSTLGLIDGADRATGEPYQLLRAGRQVLTRTGLEEGEGSVPAITGYVMAFARCRLWQLMTELGHDRLLYVDTDSLLVEGRHKAAMDAVAAAHPEWGLRVKRSWPAADIRAPRQIILGGEPRIAGVPRAARRVGVDTFAGEVWQTMEGALRRGRPDQVTVAPRRWQLRGTDNRRLHLAGGLTAARVCGDGAGGDADRQVERVEPVVAGAGLLLAAD